MIGIEHIATNGSKRTARVVGRVPLILFCSVLTGCTGLKYATEERPLLSSTSVEWNEAPESEADEALRELTAVVAPTPNNSLLGMRPTVALHNMTKEPKKPKGLRHFLKYTIGSRPIYADTLPVQDINAALVNRMNNRGHFAAAASSRMEQQGKKAVVVFAVTPGTPHRLRTIRMGDGTAAGLDSALASMLESATIHTGETYHLAHLIEERQRVADGLREQGWFRLRADDLVWTSDSTAGDHLMDLHLRVKAGTGQAKRTAYSIGSVTLHGDQDELLPPLDTAVVDSVRYVNYLGMYRPSTIVRGVFIRPGETYSLMRSDATRRYLNSYGVFRNVLVSYTDDSLRENVLHAEVALKPLKRFSLFSELNAISKSNNFAGPGLKFGVRDRNLFRGAEQFTLDLNGRFEVQVGSNSSGNYAYEIGIKAGLQIPRMLLLPFLRTVRTAAPTTVFEGGFGLFRRIGLYGQRSVSGSMGYTWRTNERTWHDLKVLEVSYNNLYYSSDEFDAFLDENPTVRRSFEESFIVGFGYTYTRSTKKRIGQRNWLVYSLGFDEAGGLLSLAFQGITGPRPEEGYALFEQRYSQYVRVRPEVRMYNAIGSGDNKLVTRLLFNEAYAYGNSTVIPYVKQFFAGGTNSLRGFRSRGVGPGSYVPVDNADLQVDQVGDIKLEANVEYRFTLSGRVKGALFADAGNVWLLRDDPQRPGGDFAWDRFVSEVALDAGFGIRYDPEVIVIRLDLAAPLRRPDLPAGDRWVFNDFDRQWARNLILNFAIGYPF